MGTLRHYFPSQQNLRDSVLAFIMEGAVPDDRIHDESIPAKQRLFDNLYRMLSAVGTGEDARAMWVGVFDNLIGPEAPEKLRDSYPALDEQALRRVEEWLSVLVQQGSLDRGDNTVRARLLLTVVNGLALGRAFPAGDGGLEGEVKTLTLALDALPFLSAR